MRFLRFSLVFSFNFCVALAGLTAEQWKSHSKIPSGVNAEKCARILVSVADSAANSGVRVDYENMKCRASGACQFDWAPLYGLENFTLSFGDRVVEPLGFVRERAAYAVKASKAEEAFTKLNDSFDTDRQIEKIAKLMLQETLSDGLRRSAWVAMTLDSSGEFQAVRSNVVLSDWVDSRKRGHPGVVDVRRVWDEFSAFQRRVVPGRNVVGYLLVSVSDVKNEPPTMQELQLTDHLQLTLQASVSQAFDANPSAAQMLRLSPGQQEGSLNLFEYQPGGKGAP